MLKMIMAMDKHRLIGNQNQLPWHLPNDLSYFKKMTLNQTVVMGRKTFESLGGALPERENIVFTRNRDWKASNVKCCCQIETILEKAQKEDVFIIGGAELCEAFLPYVKKLYVTLVEGDFEGDTYFPVINKKEWELNSEVKGKLDDKNIYPHSFLTYVRKK